MSNETDGTSTEMTEPIAQRIVLATQAAEILGKTRRPSPFAGLRPLLADEIIALAEYLRLGDGSPPEPEHKQFVEVAKLQVGDVFRMGSMPYVIVRPPIAQGTKIAAKSRPMPGGIAHLVDWDIDSTVEVIKRGEDAAPATVRVKMADLRIGDVIVYDTGAHDRVIKWKPTGIDRMVEITTQSDLHPEAGTGTLPFSLESDEEVSVLLPRPVQDGQH